MTSGTTLLKGGPAAAPPLAAVPALPAAPRPLPRPLQGGREAGVGAADAPVLPALAGSAGCLPARAGACTLRASSPALRLDPHRSARGGVISSEVGVFEEELDGAGLSGDGQSRSSDRGAGGGSTAAGDPSGQARFDVGTNGAAGSMAGGGGAAGGGATASAGSIGTALGAGSRFDHFAAMQQAQAAAAGAVSAGGSTSGSVVGSTLGGGAAATSAAGSTAGTDALTTSAASSAGALGPGSQPAIAGTAGSVGGATAGGLTIAQQQAAAASSQPSGAAISSGGSALPAAAAGSLAAQVGGAAGGSAAGSSPASLASLAGPGAFGAARAAGLGAAAGSAEGEAPGASAAAAGAATRPDTAAGTGSAAGAAFLQQQLSRLEAARGNEGGVEAALGERIAALLACPARRSLRALRIAGQQCQGQGAAERWRGRVTLPTLSHVSAPLAIFVLQPPSFVTHMRAGLLPRQEPPPLVCSRQPPAQQVLPALALGASLRPQPALWAAALQAWAPALQRWRRCRKKLRR